MSVRVPRNDPCPCGSGKKFKRCCIDRVDELEASLATTLSAVSALPLFFPRLRPMNESFESWAAAQDGRLPEHLLDEGLDLVDPQERRRIRTEAVTESVLAWKKVCARVGADLAQDALLWGGVLVAVDECRELHTELLELVEGDQDADPATVALVLHAHDLWGTAETERADESLQEIPDEVDDAEYERRWEAALSDAAGRFWSPAHEARLALLAGRVRRRLPVDGFPQASAVLLAGCERVARDKRFCRAVGVELLGDAVGELYLPAWPVAA